jgi:phosphomannomutase
MTKNIVLLDMDGTVTPARESISREMIPVILDLCYSVDVAIVSGSDYNYIMDQCGEAFMAAGYASHVVLMPCNGTKMYRFNGTEYVKEYSASLVNEIGEDLYRKIVQGILKSQCNMISKYDFSISGNFISYRESTINWSLIGRNSSLEARAKFSSREDKDKIRGDAINSFIQLSDLTKDDLKKIEFVLGGQTSIDIYPKGWDKTYALKHIPGRTAWFVGDRCESGQNDYHIYKELGDKAFATSGPKETIDIIDLIINTLGRGQTS